MPKYKKGDYVKVEFHAHDKAEPGWGWVLVESCDDAKQSVFGTVVTAGGSKPKLGTEAFFNYSLITEHKKSADFKSAHR